MDDKKNTQEDVNNIKTIGKKGLFLQDMFKAQVLTPAGFVIVKAYDQFMMGTGLYAKIKEILESVKPKLDNIDSILSASNQIINQIQKTKMPKKLEESIMSEFKILKVDYVSIRHSSVVDDEFNDFLKKEFCPQLNIDKEQLIRSIKNSWQSYFSPLAISYRLENNMNIDDPFSVLLIQKMINSEVSGICFTANPLTKTTSHITIEANYGLYGKKDQTLFRDIYVVNKNDKKILGKTINTQKTMLSRINSQTIEVDVGEMSVKMQKLTDKEIVNLVKIALRVENFYKGKPQRLEWALEKNKFYIFESEEIKLK